MTQPWFGPLIGAFLGFLSALAFSTVVRWRDVERSRSEIRSLIELLNVELQRRWDILNDRYADFDVGVLGYELKKMNFGKSGITFNYANELIPYRKIFDEFSDKLLSLSPDVSKPLYEHYQFMDENLQAHLDYLNSSRKDDAKAEAVLVSLRMQAAQLLELTSVEKQKFESRGFFVWFPLWVRGKS